MTDPTWAGDERRKTDPRILAAHEATDRKIDVALAEIRHVYGVAEELAVAVSKSVPRDEIEAREREQKERERQFKEQARLIVIGQVLLFVVLFAFSMWQVGRLEHRLDSGHDVILCFERLPETTRIDPQAGAVAIQTCKQTVK
jgi:hypothetical protein